MELPPGEVLDTFDDPDTLTTFNRDRLVTPIFDSAGRIVARMEVITTPPIGTGSSAIADVIRYQVVSEKTTTITDFSDQDARIGRVSASVNIGLTDQAPAGASLGVAIQREPSSQELQRAIEDAVSAGKSLLKEIGYLAIVTKTNMDQPGLLTDSAISMDVGKGFVDANGANNIRIVGIDGGVASVLPTTLAAYNATTATFEATAPGNVTTFALVAAWLPPQVTPPPAAPKIALGATGATVPLVFALGSSAAATDDAGNRYAPTGALTFGEGSIYVVWPFAVPLGRSISAFSDPATGITLQGSNLRIPLFDSTGVEIASIQATITAPTGLGNRAVSGVSNMNIVTNRDATRIDVSRTNPTVGYAAASIAQQLKALPTTAPIVTISVHAAPTTAERRLLEARAAALPNNLLDEVAFITRASVIGVASREMGSATVTMEVAPTFLQRKSPGAIAIMRIPDGGQQAELLSTQLIAFNTSGAVFQATSTAGASTFALVSLYNPQVLVSPTPPVTGDVASSSAVWVALLAAGLLLVVLGGFYLRRSFKEQM